MHTMYVQFSAKKKQQKNTRTYLGLGKWPAEFLVVGENNNALAIFVIGPQKSASLLHEISSDTGNSSDRPKTGSLHLGKEYTGTTLPNSSGKFCVSGEYIQNQNEKQRT